MSPYLQKLLAVRRCNITSERSDWNDGTINLPVFFTTAEYSTRDWSIELKNEERDMVYRKKDWMQQHVINLWNIKATKDNGPFHEKIQISRASWVDRKIRFRNAMNIKCDELELKRRLEDDLVLKDLFKNPFVTFEIMGIQMEHSYVLSTSFNVNKFTEQKVELALKCMEKVIEFMKGKPA